MKIEKLIPSKFPYEGSGDNLIIAFKKINRNFDALGVKDVTYDQLVEMITYSRLIPGTYYRITDFQTVHYLITGVYENVWLLPLTINSGPIEKLIVQAISSNTLKPEAYSEEYPEDIIYYDWNPDNWLKDVGFSDSNHEIIPGFKGVIKRRIDTDINVDIGYDWRNVVFPRWKFDPKHNPLGFTSYNSNYLCYNPLHALNVNDYQLFKTIHSFSANPLEQIKKEVVDITIKTGPEKINGSGDGRRITGSILTNNVFMLDEESYGYYQTYTNYFSSACGCNTFGSSISDSHCSGSLYGNLFAGYIYSLNVLTSMSNCKFKDVFYLTVNGTYFIENNFKGDVRVATFAGDFVLGNNFLKEFRRSSISGCVCGNNFDSSVDCCDFKGNAVWGLDVPNLGATIFNNTFTNYRPVVDPAETTVFTFDVDDIEVPTKFFTIPSHGLTIGKTYFFKYETISGSKLQNHTEGGINYYIVVDSNTLKLVAGDGIAHVFWQKPASGQYRLTLARSLDFSGSSHLTTKNQCTLFSTDLGNYKLKYVKEDPGTGVCTEEIVDYNA